MEGDIVWVGTTGGLVKLNKTTGEKTLYSKANSGLPGKIYNQCFYKGKIGWDHSTITVTQLSSELNHFVQKTIIKPVTIKFLKH